jgi:hypothetical protein
MGVPNLCTRWRAFNASAGSRWRRSSRCPAVTPDMSGVHRTCPVNYSGAAVTISRGCQVPDPRPLGAPDTVRCAPDSPVNYSAPALRIPEGEEFAVDLPWCTGHVRWHTGQSGAPAQGAFGCSFAPLFEPNSGLFNWLVVNLWRLYNLYTRAN